MVFRIQIWDNGRLKIIKRKERMNDIESLEKMQILNPLNVE